MKKLGVCGTIATCVWRGLVELINDCCKCRARKCSSGVGKGQEFYPFCSPLNQPWSRVSFYDQSEKSPLVNMSVVLGVLNPFFLNIMICTLLRILGKNIYEEGILKKATIHRQRTNNWQQPYMTTIAHQSSSKYTNYSSLANMANQGMGMGRENTHATSYSVSNIILHTTAKNMPRINKCIWNSTVIHAEHIR